MRNPLEKTFKILVIPVSIFFAVLLLICYLTPYVSPLDMWYFGIIALLYPFILFVNLFFLVLSFFRKRKIYRYILLAVILSGYMYHHRFFALHFQAKKHIKSEDIRLLTYNVKVFDLYNWSKNLNSKNHMIHFVDSVQPDIVCLQEFLYDDRNKFNTTDTLSILLNTKYIHQEFTTKHRNHHFGSATFSKYPIIHKSQISFKNSKNLVLITDIVKEEDTLRIFNCHMQSIQFAQKEVNYIDSISENINKQSFKELYPILKRLKRAFHKRARQVMIFRDSIDHSPYPIIICGDFNDVPNSYTYQTIARELYDSFLEAGSGVGTTFSEFSIPYRIDYILYSSEFDVVFSKKFSLKYSDHFPYFSVLRIKK